MPLPRGSLGALMTRKYCTAEPGEYVFSEVNGKA
jgi:hypothetical protein